ncbi:type II toxin-antitoxin system VapC family toxin [Kineosporia sp. R_H_3]|uniref:type II toxin-antitoxin system VapC family toxin n=1 Tax=Kineosporia sp. R_H_3 TaxID=1961848 RepID=UPI000B4B6C1E|nr:type II toxin-antitoxin system VapC family toxin [Kineosporia sp. R_H_3]
MIVLDTNVVSELMEAAPDPAVIDWLRRQGRPGFATTSVTVGEVTYGIENMPAGRRRETKAQAAARVWAAFPGAVLPFDRAAAEAYGALMAKRRRAGRPISTLDAQIAAICQVQGAILATRNTKDFEGLGLDVVDPWTAA